MSVDLIFAFVCGLGVGVGAATGLTFRLAARSQETSERLRRALVGINTVSQNSLCRATNEWDQKLADLIEEHAKLAGIAAGVTVPPHQPKTK